MVAPLCAARCWRAVDRGADPAAATSPHCRKFKKGNKLGRRGALLGSRLSCSQQGLSKKITGDRQRTPPLLFPTQLGLIGDAAPLMCTCVGTYRGNKNKLATRDQVESKVEELRRLKRARTEAGSSHSAV